MSSIVAVNQPDREGGPAGISFLSNKIIMVMNYYIYSSNDDEVKFEDVDGAISGD